MIRGKHIIAIKTVKRLSSRRADHKIRTTRSVSNRRRKCLPGAEIEIAVLISGRLRRCDAQVGGLKLIRLGVPRRAA